MTSHQVLPVPAAKALRRMILRSPLGAAIVIALLGLAVDQASKAWAFAAMSGPARLREVAPGIVTTVLARNDGAVANLAGGRPSTATLCALNGLLMLGAACWSHRRLERRPRRDAAFLGLLAGGMLGNSLDRLALGYVRDFLVTALWPAWIFNLADVLIVVGFLLLLGSWAASRLGRAGATGTRGWGGCEGGHPGP